MNQGKLFLLWLIIALTFLFFPILLFSNTAYYSLRFDHYKIYQNFDIPEEYVDNRFSELNKFLLPFGNELDESFFSKEDILHLKDVKNIIDYIYFTFFISVFLILGFRNIIWNNYKQLALFSKYYLASVFLISLFVLVKFDWFFTSAHELVFPNNYWFLDPRTSNLIKFFPEQLFLEVFLIVVIFNICLHLSFIMIYRLRYEK